MDPTGGGIRQREELVAPREFSDELANLNRRAEDAADVAATVLAKELESLLGEVPPEWLGGPEQSAVGDIWALLARYEKAVDCYEAAQQDWGVSGSVKSVEQLLNVRAKWAVERARQPEGDDPTADDLLRLAEEAADLLLKMGATPERYSLQGSVARRRAQCVPADGGPAALTLALVDARDAYRRAVELHRERHGTIDFYPALNAVVLGWLAHERDAGQPFDPEEVKKLITGSREAAQAVRRPDFWSRVTPADADLAKALVAGDLPGKESAIAEKYFAAFAQSSRRDRAAVLEHVDLVRRALPAPPDDPVAEALKCLRNLLAEWSAQ